MLGLWKWNRITATASSKRERMAKHNASTGSKTKAFNNAESHPSKKVKTSHESSSYPKDDPAARKSNHDESENVQLKGPLVLRGEETAFPRGGASVLTPLEHRQIKIDAQRDVLFEQTGNRSTKRTADDFEYDGEDEINASTPASAKKKIRPTPKPKQEVPRLDAKESSVRIEGLGYRVINVMRLSRTYG